LGLNIIETALYGGPVEEVYAAGKPHPSLQGCIYGVFRNRLPIEGGQLRPFYDRCDFMQRKYTQRIAFELTENRQLLFVSGPRLVGKTTIVRVDSPESFKI